MKFLSTFIFLVLISTFAVQAQVKEDFNPSKYTNDILKKRTLKNAEMLTDAHSPIPDEEKVSFQKLNYYKPNAKFRKVASFERFDQATHFLMKTSTDRLPEYSIYGKVTFMHKNKSYSLNVYQNIDLIKKPGFEKYLFIPFNDETNEHETYGAGRFLDVYETGTDMLVIDFNEAYNPYCAYNHKYSCPIPPESNNLKLKVKAGEKKWHK